MGRSLHIALAFQVSVPHLERIAHGIMDYARLHGPWRFHSSPEASVVRLDGLTTWNGDGVIALVDTSTQLGFAQSLSFPVVNVSAGLSPQETGLPTVVCEDRQVGNLAAKHLLERGFQRFGFYGLGETYYSKEREEGFRETVEEAGFCCEVFLAKSALHTDSLWHEEREPLEKWLGQFRPPVGLFATHDYRARMLLEACADIGLEVPKEVAVVGVNNDPLACEFCHPSLTSVAQDAQQIGYEAAALLSQMLANKKLDEKVLYIPPAGIVKRASTDVLTVDDPTLSRAIEIILASTNLSIDVEQLAAQLHISRRWLERLFRIHLNNSPHEFIGRLRMDRAESLLIQLPSKKLKDIAHECGFSDVRCLNRVFRRFRGMSPREFRRSHSPDESFTRQTSPFRGDKNGNDCNRRLPNGQLAKRSKSVGASWSCCHHHERPPRRLFSLV